MKLSDRIDEALSDIRAAGRYREVLALESPPGPRVRIGGRILVNLCGNDYLSLAVDPRVTAAAAKAAIDEGAGAGASRLVTGNPPGHAALEERLARFLGVEAALLFGSGWHANTGFIPALAGEGDLILSDELNHASLIDGCRLSRADKAVYRHADLDHLESLLKARRGGARVALVVTESVFSMDGDAPDLAGLAALCERHDAALAVDEAHALGVVGDGRGSLAATPGARADVIVGTFGKALGSFGAFVAGSARLRDLLINTARSAIFSTALPPAAVGATAAALSIVEREGSEMTEALRARVDRLAGCVEKATGVRPTCAGAVVPYVIGSEADALASAKRFFDAGVLARAIRPPTVPAGTCRLRLTACRGHDGADLDAVDAAFRAAQG